MTERETNSYSYADLRLKAPVWVRVWRSIHLGWLVAFVGMCAALIALLVSVVLMFETLPRDAFMGFSLLAFVVCGSIGLAVVLSGIGSARLSRFVRPVDVAAVGRGLSVPGRGDFLIRGMILGFGLLACASQFLWRDDEPGRLRAKTEIAALIGAPAFLLYFVVGLVFVHRTRISLHCDGIVQEIYRRRAWTVTSAVTVVPWEEIVALQPHGHPNPAVSNPDWYPTVRVVYRAASDESDQILILMVCEKKVEPNSFLALLQWCRDNPWARTQLGRDDARELLRPPGLVERFRADRAAATSGGRDAIQ